MAHAVLLEDSSGDVVDARYYCCDTCAQTDTEYAGWYGCVELDFTTACEACGDTMEGIVS